MSTKKMERRSPLVGGQNKQGTCLVKPSKKVEWEQRLHALGETIEYWLTHRTDKTVEIIQLFY